MSVKNKIKRIVFGYGGHDRITTKVEYETNCDEVTGKGTKGSVTSDIVMKIEEDKEHKSFDYEKIYTRQGEIGGYKSVYFYDRRTTATLESDEHRKKILTDTFSNNKEAKNVLLIQDSLTTLVFEDIDTNAIDYRISSRAKKGGDIKNFKENFFSSKINTDEIDLINSIHFTYSSYGAAKQITEKLAHILALQSIRKYPNATERGLTMDSVSGLTYKFNKYLLNKFVTEDIPLASDDRDLVNALIKEDKANDNLFESVFEATEKVLDKKALRSHRIFQRVLASEELERLARTNLPLKSEIERLQKARFDSILMNLDESANLETLTEFYKDNNYGHLVVQDNETEFHSRNLYRVAVEKDDLELTLTPSTSTECDGLNKIIDLRGIQDIEAKKEIFKILFSKPIQNVTFISDKAEDMSFIVSTANVGNYYKLDGRYLGNESENPIYIADVSEISYRYNAEAMSFKDLLNVNLYAMHNKVIKFPEYNPALSPIVNLAEAKNRLVDKVIASKEMLVDKKDNSPKINHLYKYDKAIAKKQEEFSIAEINKQYQIAKKSEEYYNFAKQNIGKFFKGQLELVFSSLNVAKDKKIFNNDFFFNMPSTISMEQIENSIAAKSYISRSPSGEVVAKIAKKFNINIEAKKPFSLSNLEQNKLSIAKKEKVTSLNLGVMHFKYIPKTFELKDEDKDIFVEIVKSIISKNSTLTDEKKANELQELGKALNDAHYLVVKNEQTIIDSMKIAPKEVLVLIDEDLKDISKMNISIKEFYQELEDRKIFNVEDYVEVVKPNSIYLEKMGKNIANFVGDFRKTHIEFSGIKEETFNRTLEEKTIKLPNSDTTYTPEEILISNMPKEAKNILLLRLGKALEVEKYYNEFINFQTTDTLIQWVEKQKIDATAKEKIVTLLLQVNGKEIKAIENNSGVIFPALQSYLNDNTELYEKLEDKINKLYHSKKQEEKAILKTTKLYIVEKMFIKTMDKISEINKTYKGAELEQQKELLYPYLKNAVDIIMDDIMELTPAQRNEAINYSILKDGKLKDTLMTLWEMRAGKTRAAITAVLLTSMIDGNSRNIKRNMMFVQNKNLPDIAEQSFDLLPIVAKDIQFNSNEEVSIFKKAKSLELPVNISKQITPHIIQTLKKYIKFQGQKDSLKSDSVVLSQTYTQEMNQIQKEIRLHSLDELIDIYKNSPFLDTLKIAKTPKLDKDIRNSITQSFVYVEMLYRKNYLSADKSEIVYEKIMEFTEKYISAKGQMKQNNVSKIGLDIIPKNLLYSVNVNSQVTNANIEESSKIEKKGSIYLSSPYEVNFENQKELYLHNFGDPLQKEKYENLVLDSVGMSQRMKDLSDEGKVYKIATSYSDNEILNLKEQMAYSFISNISKNFDGDFLAIMSRYIKDNTTETTLIPSKMYHIEGLDEQFEDTIEINLNDLFSTSKLEEYLKQYGNEYDSEIKTLMEYIENPSNVANFAKEHNAEYFRNIIKPLYDSTLASSVRRRVAIFSPLLANKHKDLIYGLKVDMEIVGDKFVYPVKKEIKDKTPIYSTQIADVGHDKIDLLNLSKKINKSLNGLQIDFGFTKSNPIITVKKEQNPNLMLDNIVKRNEKLNSYYTVDLRSDLSNITIDESHKGLKTNSATLNIHDVTSYLHKIAVKNDGTFVLMSGTPMSGKAGDIGRLTTTGVDTMQSELISKDIKKYCTVYEFKDSYDAVLFASMEAFPEGFVQKGFEEILLLPEDKLRINKDSFQLTKPTIEGIKEEIKKVINNIPNLEQVDKNELIKERTRESSIVSKFNHYREIFKMGDYINKVASSKNIIRKSNNVRELLLSKLTLLTKEANGVNNLQTFADIIGNISNSNAISITRATKNATYDILDKDLLIKQTELKDTKTPIAINVNSFKDKTLALDGFLSAYKGKLQLGAIKETLKGIFENWAVEMFNEDNIERTMANLSLSAKYKVEDINTLLSRSGKSVKDSALDVFDTMYFGSHKEKEELAESDKLKEKVNFVIDIIDGFMEFTQDYYEFQNNARLAARQEAEQALNEDRDKKTVYVNYKGYKFSADRFADLSPLINNSLALFDKASMKDIKEVVTMNGTGDVYMGRMPVVFKTQIEVNNWEGIYNDTLKINYSLTNQAESEILEYLGSESSELYTEHINKGENIRVMSTRNATLAISFLDTVKAMAEREDKSKKAVIILNKNSTKDYNYVKMVNSLDKEMLEKANIEIRLTTSSTFSTTLDEVKKNPNNQIAVVGNYVALAEGIDMSCIDTGFYVGSLRESAETIQSFARQRGYGKECSSFYLGNNGKFERYRMSSSITYEKILSGGDAVNLLAREVFKGSLALYNNSNGFIDILQDLHFEKCVSSIILSTSATLSKVEAYEAVMSGKYPTSDYDYEKTSLMTYSDVYKNRDMGRDGSRDAEIEYNNEEEIEIDNKKDL